MIHNSQRGEVTQLKCEMQTQISTIISPHLSGGSVDPMEGLPVYFWHESCLCQLCGFATIFSKLCAFPILLFPISTTPKLLSRGSISYFPGIVGKFPPATWLVPLDPSTMYLSRNSDTIPLLLCILTVSGEKAPLLTCL